MCLFGIVPCSLETRCEGYYCKVRSTAYFSLALKALFNRFRLSEVGAESLLFTPILFAETKAFHDDAMRAE